MSNEKLMDDLSNLLDQMQEMETEARKSAKIERHKGNDKLSHYEKGKEWACETLKRELTQILYEAKRERMPEGDVEKQ